MSKLLLLFSLLICLRTEAQVVRGQILEKDTNEPVANTNVYYDGTFLGVISDKDGNFAIQMGSSNKVPIIVSSIGFNTYTLRDYSVTEPVKIHLERKVYMLNEVTINDDGMSRDEKIKAFKDDYLGSSIFAKTSVIENLDDIDLRFDRQTGTLTASSENPIIISNKALGYQVKTFLNHFTRGAGYVSYSGNQIFEQDSSSRTISTNISRARELAYLGSRMHFIRSLWSNTLAKNGFRVIAPINKNIAYKDLVVSENGEKYLIVKGSIEIRYGKRLSRISSTIRPSSRAYIDKNGFFDASQIRWSGDMGGQRMGDVLPFEFESK